MQLLLFALLMWGGQTPDPEAGFLATLRSDAPPHVKAEACRQLAPIATRRAVPTLATMLSDESLSHMARFVLEVIPDPSADAALRAALPVVKGRTLVGVIASLGVRKDTKARRPLVALLGDSDPLVAQAAARALGCIGGATTTLLKHMTEAEPGMREAIAEGLLRTAGCASPGEAISIYDRLRVMSELPGHVRIAALVGAIRARGSKGAKLALEAIRLGDDDAAGAAIRTAAELPGATVTRALAAEIERAAPERQILIVEALGDRRDTSALPTHERLTKSSSPALRAAAVRALAQIGRPASVPLLIELVTDGDEGVMAAARSALVGFPESGADAPLVRALGVAKSTAFVALADVAAQRRTLGSVPVLLRAAEDTDSSIAGAAYRALGELASAADLEAMADGLQRTGDLAAGEAALVAVCARQSDPSACADRLLTALARAVGEPKVALLRVLGSVGGTKALDAVRAAVSDADAPTRSAALRVLCEWPDTEALPDLVSLARAATDSSQRIMAIRGALRLTASPALSQEEKHRRLSELMPLVERKDETVQALAILGDMSSEAALQMIVPCLTDAEVRNEAALSAVAVAERILAERPAEAADALGLVETDDTSLAERARRLLDRIPPNAVEDGFTPIFNGRDLTGWDGKPGWWTVQEGAITSESTPEKPCGEANYLIWRGGQPSDFELRASFRLSPAANSGIQIRSEERPNWDTFGYQADMTGDGELVGFVYHHSRGLIAGRGENVTLAADGTRTVETIGDAAKLRLRFRPNRWNSYRIVCRGPQIALYVNGVLMCRVTDNGATPAAAKGIIALQMHPGPPMKVEFRNLRIRMDPPQPRPAD